MLLRVCCNVSGCWLLRLCDLGDGLQALDSCLPVSYVRMLFVLSKRDAQIAQCCFSILQQFSYDILRRSRRC